MLGRFWFLQRGDAHQALHCIGCRDLVRVPFALVPNCQHRRSPGARKSFSQQDVGFFVEVLPRLDFIGSDCEPTRALALMEMCATNWIEGSYLGKVDTYISL